MKDSYPGMLRESLLVRAVSQMENYLVHLLREIAQRDLSPFKHHDKTLSFSQAHLLSFSSADQLRDYILDAECRALNGRGFREFEKYYKHRFRISFSQSPLSVDDVDEIYTRRHILVHAGGYVDDQYCRRFGTMMKPGERLQIGEQYFLDATKKPESLAQYCADRVEALFPEPAGSVPVLVERLLAANGDAIARAAHTLLPGEIAVAQCVSANFASIELLEEHFANDSTFGFGTSRIQNNTLITARERISDTTMQWLICGAKPVVGAYISYVTYLERKGVITEIATYKIPLVQGHPYWKRFNSNKNIENDD